MDAVVAPGRARAQAAGDCGATSKVEIMSPERLPVQLCCSEASKFLGHFLEKGAPGWDIRQ